MIVVSTAYDPPRDARQRCLDSVRAAGVLHRYIDAARQATPLSHFENLLAAVDDRLDDEVVVALDGDDWLLPGALARVQQEHDAGALVTYGSFRYADGRPGFAAQAPVDLRRSPWVTTHLKSFRAGLLRRIDPAHLQRDGAWLEHARDLALMFPLLEMVGPERSRYIPDVLYVYNYANSTEFRGTAETLAAERRDVAYVRGLPPYARIP